MNEPRRLCVYLPKEFSTPLSLKQSQGMSSLRGRVFFYHGMTYEDFKRILR
uniref:Uncharacterized protein n=1 Tax=Arundo donax TaxID=35708 RepID=A0A0A9CLE4_ARUDO